MRGLRRRKPDPRVSVAGQPMDAEGVVIRALFDPGAFVVRRAADHLGELYAVEEMHRWQAHAAVEALRLAGYRLAPKRGTRETRPRARVVPVAAASGGGGQNGG